MQEGFCVIAEIIGVGTAPESEETLSSNAALIVRELEACGISAGPCTWAGGAQQLRGAIAKALGRGDIVIIIGGLGPGPDGIAKQVVCDGLGRKLVMHDASLRRIRAAYERAGRQMPQQVSRLAMMPEQSVVFPGVRGVTPGCALSAGNQFIILMPDEPREFVPMLQHSVMPYLAKFSEAAVVTRTVNAFGPDEAQMRELLGSILSSQNPTVAVYPKRGEYQVRVTARAKDKGAAAALCEPVIREITRRLGEAAYGADAQSLAAQAAGELRGAGLAVSIAESGTGSLLGEMLKAAPEVLAYCVSAGSDRIKIETLGVSDKLLKKYESASAQAAAAMAAGALKQGRSAIGVAVAVGAPDQKKQRDAFAALTDGQHVWIRRVPARDNESADAARLRACLSALDLVRLYITALPQQYRGANPLQAALSGKALELLGTEAGQSASAEGEAAMAKKKKGILARIFPCKGDSTADVVRKMILIVAVCVFVASAGYLLLFYGESARNRKEAAGWADAYNTALGLDDTDVEVPDGYPQGYQLKFANLYKINEDIAGWLLIADTQVNYPVVHYQDNEYYLRRDFNGNDSKYGTPWLEANDSLDPQSDNYIIYAHNMTDGQMFGELMQYKGATGTKDFANPDAGIAYLREHPIISFDDVYRDNDYKIVSVFITNAKEAYGPMFYYNDYLDLSDPERFNAFVDEITARSYYNSNVDIRQGDQFLMLSTCSYEYGPVSDDAHVRTVVVGRRVRDGEKNDGSDIEYTVNPSPRMPQGFAGGKPPADVVAQANAEQGTGLVPGPTTPAGGASAAAPAAPAASAAAGTSSASASQPQASSASSVSSAPDAELNDYEYEARQLAADAQAAEQRARDARDTARQSAREAERNSTSASQARREAGRAEEAASSAARYWETADDAAYEAERIYNEYESAVTREAYETAVAAAKSARNYRDEAEEYAADARYAADKKAPESSSQPTSSSQAPSSSEPKPSSSEPKPSSSEPKPPSSEPKPSSSEPKPSSSEEEDLLEPSSTAPENNNNAADDTDKSEDESTTGGTDVLPAYSSKEKLTVVSGGKKTTGKARDIVAQVVMTEMGASFNEEALKAQAVAAYTYIKQQNASGATPYLGLRSPSSNVEEAVDKVIGEAVYYKGSIAFTPFYATSAGVTAASADVWGGSYPYLVSVDSEIDEQARNYEVATTMSASKVADRIGSVFGVDLYDYSDDPNNWFDIRSYTEGDRYIDVIYVGNKKTTGRAVREQALGLRSAAFDIDYDAGSDEFTFTTYGYGHGVGMSQTGANLYANEEGWDYIEILEHYYPGCRVR
nr:SpoIID/LytB domain-containing protein [Anaerotruncus colihominis]